MIGMSGKRNSTKRAAGAAGDAKLKAKTTTAATRLVSK
jgi:hypothetical protein